MKAPKTLMLFIILSLFLPELSSQSVIRQSINCFGGSRHVDGGVVSETVGQFYSTNKFLDPDLYINPGFQQKMTAFIKEKEILDELQIQLYPNPVSDELHLVSGEMIEDVRIEITDISGKIVLLSEHADFVDKMIHLGHFSEGLYNIRITDEKMGKSHNSRIIIIK